MQDFSRGLLCDFADVLAYGEFQNGLLRFTPNSRLQVVFQPFCDSRVIAEVDGKETFGARQSCADFEKHIFSQTCLL